jgi:hypothetical protein
MAITITHIDGAGDTNAGAATDQVTSSFARSANRLYVMLTHNTTSSPAAPNPTAVDAGGLTWVAIDGVLYDSSNRRIKAFRAMKSTGLSTEATTISYSAAPTGFMYDIYEIDGVDTGGTDGSGAVVESKVDTGSNVTTATITLADMTNVSAVFAAFGIFVADTPTEGSGYTLNTVVGHGTPTARMHSEYKLSADASAELTWTNASDWGAVFLGLKAATPAYQIVRPLGANPGGLRRRRR